MGKQDVVFAGGCTGGDNSGSSGTTFGDSVVCEVYDSKDNSRYFIRVLKIQSKGVTIHNYPDYSLELIYDDGFKELHKSLEPYEKDHYLVMCKKC